jgi:hypothetical protein
LASEGRALRRLRRLNGVTKVHEAMFEGLVRREAEARLAREAGTSKTPVMPTARDCQAEAYRCVS